MNSERKRTLINQNDLTCNCGMGVSGTPLPPISCTIRINHNRDLVALSESGRAISSRLRLGSPLEGYYFHRVYDEIQRSSNRSTRTHSTLRRNVGNGEVHRHVRTFCDWI